MDQVGVTLGVEEEFHILNPETGRLAPGSRQIMEEAPVEAAERAGTAQMEFQRSMIEQLDDVLLVSALARALVVTAAAEECAGALPAAVADELVRGATWRAARSGLRGQLIDPVAGESVSAADLVRRLVRHVGDALDSQGDTDLVIAGVDALLRRGSSAERQRRALSQGDGTAGVVAAVVAETREGL